MPHDPDIAVKAANGDNPEKQTLDDLERYSIQARATRAPFESGNSPGTGPGIADVFWSMQGGSLFLNMAQSADEIIPWTYYPMMRDRQLRQLWKSEAIIAGTVYSMSARIGALPYKVSGPPRAKKRANELLHGFDVKKWAIDYLTTDNGAFIERIGPGRPDRPLNKNLIKGLAVMDSGQCWRTFDPEFPVIYVNPYTGAFHKMHYSRVISSSSMPQPQELARGIGFCPVSRTLRAIQILRDIEIYKHEKIGGKFTRAIGLIQGFTPKTVSGTLSENDEMQDAVGLTRYQGIPWLVTMNQNAKISKEDLASLPDGFDTEKDTTMLVNAVALGFGIDTREIWPATMSGATKADATVQHEKARGKGNGDLIHTLEVDMNWGAMPDGVTMEYDYTDDEADLQKAQLHGQHIINVTTLQLNGNLTPEQGNAMLIAKGVIEPDVLSIQGAEESEPATEDDPDSGEDTADVQTPDQTDTQNGQGGPQEQQGATNANQNQNERSNNPVGGKAVKVAKFTKSEIDLLFEKAKRLPTLAQLRKQLEQDG